ncbi:MAG TPA: hypothetical protein VJG64_00645 [Candidatus Paceibacterota bacterium]
MHTHKIKLVGTVVVCAALVASAFLFVSIAHADDEATAAADATGSVELTTSVDAATDVSSETTTSSDSSDATAPADTDTSADASVTESSADESPTPTDSDTSESAGTTDTSSQEAAAATSLVSVVEPELSTDKDDYHPGETATIFGKFFGALQSFVLKIFGSDKHDENYTEETQTVTTDENGSFSTTYTLDDLYRPFYEMTASTLEGTLLASGWFRDSAIGTYDQCSNDDQNNGDGYLTGDTGCRWTFGNLQPNNSKYFEHDATVQRVWLDGFVPGSEHTITLKYGTTKGGKHAYDFLTEWDHSETWITLGDRCQDIDGCETASEDELAIPLDPNALGKETANRVFTMRGGIMSSASVPAIVSGDYSGDSETVTTITFDVANSGDMCTTKGNVTSCGVALWFGAHVSAQEDWGVGQSAVNISGAPYHVALDAIDGDAVGQRDNQMLAATVVQNSSITIIKNAVPEGPQDFSFTTTGTGLSPFSLDDDGDVTLSNTQTFSGLASGIYTVSEGAVAGWSLTGTAACADATTNSTINLATGVATINLAAGEDVTCTFVNELQQGSLQIVKRVVNDNGGTAVVGAFGVSSDAGALLFDPAVESPTNTFTYASQVMTVNAGRYTLLENDIAGYSEGTWSCTGATPSDTSINNGAVPVAAGATVVCTITNNDIAPTLTVNKVLVPASDTGLFNLQIDSSTAGTGADAGDGGTTGAVAVQAGAHTVGEVAGTGTSLSDYMTPVISGNCAPNGSITLAIGENKTCTITNTKLGRWDVFKHVINDNGGTAVATEFSFIVIMDGDVDNPLGPFFFDPNGVDPLEGKKLIPVEPGHTYKVIEVSFPDYTTTIDNAIVGDECNVFIGAGDIASCNITNNDDAPSLTLNKITNYSFGGTAPELSWTLDAAGPTPISGPGAAGAADVVSGLSFDAGTYTLSESVAPAGYTNGTTWSCTGTGTQTGNQIALDLGESAVCSITNTDQPAEIHGQKFEDNNGNGTQDGGDLGLAGWTIYLDLNSNGGLKKETGGWN